MIKYDFFTVFCIYKINDKNVIEDDKLFIE
jgi:hypothetical protein